MLCSLWSWPSHGCCSIPVCSLLLCSWAISSSSRLVLIVLCSCYLIMVTFDYIALTFQVFNIRDAISGCRWLLLPTSALFSVSFIKWKLLQLWKVDDNKYYRWQIITKILSANCIEWCAFSFVYLLRGPDGWLFLWVFEGGIENI